MSDRDASLLCGDEELLASCDAETYRASGPGGQHRNKVSSAVRLRHRPTGIVAQAEERRNQHENRRRALARLRQKLACDVRAPAPPAGEPPAVVRHCLVRGHKGGRGARPRLQVGRKNRRFWPVAAIALDLLDAHEGRLSEAAGAIGIATSNLVRLLRSDRHLLAAAQELRRRHGQKPIH
ncbi:MAG: peptide chain release factor family protein [Planctomycetota bacterium]